MNATEATYPELSADLVEKVYNLSPKGLEALRKLVEREQEEEAKGRRQMWDEILRDVAAYDRGEMKAYTLEEMTGRIERKIAALKSGVVQ